MWGARGRADVVGGEEAALGRGLGFSGRRSHLRDRSKRLLCEFQCIGINEAHRVGPRITLELEVGCDSDHDVRVVAGEGPEKRALSVRTQSRGPCRPVRAGPSDVGW